MTNIPRNLFLRHTLTGEVLTERVHWLIRLRWVAVAGMVLITAAARWGLHIGVAAGPILALAGVVAGYNALTLWWLRHQERSASAQAMGGCPRQLANAQIALDLLVLTLVLHLSGGVVNPLAVFLVFHMAISAILLPRRDAYAQAGWATLLFVGLALLEMSVPGLHRPVSNFPADMTAAGQPTGLFAQPLYVAGVCSTLTVTLFLIVYFTSDISQRLREAYGHLAQAADELAQLEQTKSRFLRVASHQLRSPLAAMHSLLSALEHTGAALDEQQRDLLHRVQDRSAVMMQLLDEMLTLSALKESTHETANRAPVAVNTVLESVVSLHAEAARAKDICLTLHVDGEVRVLAWAKALDDVFGNLVHNAVKYTPAGGRVEVQARKQGGVVVVTVADTGIGIAPKDQENLFTEFFRAGNAKQFAGGTGLGLSIVKEIVDHLGGHVVLSSAENQGTTVRVELPAL